MFIKILILLLAIVYSEAKEPTFQPPFIPKELNESEKSRQSDLLAVSVYKSTFLLPSHPLSLWNQDYLSNTPKIKIALDEYIAEKRGQTLKKISLKGDLKSLHTHLIDLGFVWKEVPLTAGKGRYWKIDGSKTKHKNDTDLVMMQIYVHPDGSMVRIKSRGIPDISGTYPQRNPQILLSVLADISEKTAKDYDTSYENEAFKVTQEGNPVPKSPSPKFGIKIPSYAGFSLAELKKVPSILMGLIHISLADNNS